jgi:hypothetical protein
MRLFALLFLLLVFIVRPGAAQPADVVSPLLISALSLSEGTRYTVSFLKPDDASLEGFTGEVKIPADAELVQVFETDKLQFVGTRADADGVALLWQAVGLSSEDALPPLAFTLAEPADRPLTARVSLQSRLRLAAEPAETARILATLIDKPAPIEAASETAQIALGPEGSGGALIPVGETGVLVGAGPGLFAESALVEVSKLPASANPPEDLDPTLGVLWWCSVVSVEGLAEGGAVSVVVPLRRPLPAFTPVQLFALREDGTWAALAAQGIVSADGQTVAYVHPGGTIATGVAAALQPAALDADAIAPADPDTAQTLADGLIGDDDGQTVFVFPACGTADADAVSAPCEMLPGVVRQCLPGFVNCTFTSRTLGLCFDAGILGSEDGAGPLCAVFPPAAGA